MKESVVDRKSLSERVITVGDKERDRDGELE